MHRENKTRQLTPFELLAIIKTANIPEAEKYRLGRDLHEAVEVDGAAHLEPKLREIFIDEIIALRTESETTS